MSTRSQAAVIITESLKDDDYDNKNIRWSGDAMTAAERTRMLGNSGLVVWMTGLSGSGKTTTAQEVERRLVAAGIPGLCTGRRQAASRTEQ